MRCRMREETMLNKDKRVEQLSGHVHMLCLNPYCSRIPGVDTDVVAP